MERTQWLSSRSRNPSIDRLMDETMAIIVDKDPTSALIELAMRCEDAICCI